MLSLTLLLWAAAPTPKEPVKPLPMFPAPLGRLGNFVEAPPVGGLPVDQRIQLGKLDGCTRDQAFFLTRAVSGTLAAVQQLDTWLQQTPGLEKKLLTRAKLAEVAQFVAASAPVETTLCAKPTVADGFKLDVTKGAGKRCAGAPGFRTGDFWWEKDKKPAAVVMLTDAPADAKDRCHPRLSVVLFDKSGIARVRVHADWSGTSSLTVLGDRCQGLDFTFDAGAQAFVPMWRPAKGCAP